MDCATYEANNDSHQVHAEESVVPDAVVVVVVVAVVVAVVVDDGSARRRVSRVQRLKRCQKVCKLRRHVNRFISPEAMDDGGGMGSDPKMGGYTGRCAGTMTRVVPV